MLSDGDELLYAFRKNVVVAASAGTGKTHRLTGLYVAVSLGLTEIERTEMPAPDGGPTIDPSRIVATTFSRAAAIEIRTRVERALKSIARGDAEEPLMAILRARTRKSNLDPSGTEIQQRACAALESMPRARIDTLHVVAQSIVRTHAMRLGIAPNARIEDADETKQIVFGAVDRVLGEALDQGADAAVAARELLRATSGLDRLREDARSLFDRMDEDGIDAHALVVQDHVAHANERWDELHRIARACAATSASKLLVHAARDVVRLLPRKPTAELSTETAEALGRLFGTKSSKNQAAEVELGAFAKSLAKNKREAPRSLLDLVSSAPALARRESSMVQIVGQMRARVSAERARRSVLSFGDLLRLTRLALATNDSIWRESRADIDALFVDEFQDTSLVQRDIIYLLRETEAGRKRRRALVIDEPPSARDIKRSGLFLVGDRKQSIYAFRGADVSVFSRVAMELGGNVARLALGFPVEDIGPDGEAGSDAVADFLTLTESRRSVPEIVDFVNEVSLADFDRDIEGAPRDFEIKYGHAEELVSTAPRDRGHVLLVRDDGTALPGDASRALSREAQMAALLVSRLERSGIQRRDIAILARRRATIPLIEQALSNQGVQFVVAGRALYQTQEVRDIAAFLRCLIDPQDKHAIATILRGPFVCLSDSALLSLTDNRGLDPRALSRSGKSLDRDLFPDEAERLDSFRITFARINEALRRTTPSAAIRELRCAFEVDRLLAALPRALTRTGNVERLIEIAGKQGGSVASFSRWLDRQIEDETDEPEAVVFSKEDDAVRVTTIHGSKGLDFESVVLVDIDAGPGARNKSLSYLLDRDTRRATLLVRHKSASGSKLPNQALEEGSREARSRESAERRRLSYVAITRAKRELAIVLPERAPKKETLFFTIVELALAGKCSAEHANLKDWLTRGSTEPERAENEQLETTAAFVEPPPSATKRLALATTPLSVFRGCERRFQLRFLVGLEEPVASGQLDLFAEGTGSERARDTLDEENERDPRKTGRAAHRVLELLPRADFGRALDAEELRVALVREGATMAEAPRLAIHLKALISGPWAQTLSEGQAELYREEEIGFDVEGRVQLHLRGTVDLYAKKEDRIEIVDYKLARPKTNLSPYAFQLRAYAFGLARIFPSVPIKAGVVFLQGAIEPYWIESESGGQLLTSNDHRVFGAQLSKLSERFASARGAALYKPEAIARCRSLACGFQSSCHPKR